MCSNILLDNNESVRAAFFCDHFGGLNGDDSDSEDAQRGRELRCTYGLAAVREENERFKDWFMRKAYGPRIEPVRYELGMLVGDEIDMPS